MTKGALVLAVACLLHAAGGQIVTRYGFDSDAKDTKGANDLSGTYRRERDGVCGAGHLLKVNEFLQNRQPKNVPLGNAPFTVSAYVKLVSRGRRVIWHLGAEGRDQDLQGFALQVEDNSQLTLLDWKNNHRIPYVVLNQGQFYHFVVTYDGQTARLYVDGLEVYSYKVKLALVVSDAYGALSIGESHLGGTRIARFGEYVVDEVKIALSVLPLSQTLSPCQKTSEFTFETDAEDVVGSNNLEGTYAPVVEDTVCGRATVLEPGASLVKGLGVGLPLEKEAWTLSLHARAVKRGQRMLMQMGGTSWPYAGFGIGMSEDMRLFIRDFGANPRIETPLHVDTWYHIVAKYDGSVMEVYLNGALFHAYEATLDLGNGRFVIGGYDAEDKAGTYVVDELVLTKGRAGAALLKSGCGVISKYDFETGVFDTVGNNHLSGSYEPEFKQTVCGAAQRLLPMKLNGKRDPTRVPLGNQGWTMALYFQMVAAGDRVLIHLGADDGAYKGVGLASDSRGNLYVFDYHRRPRVGVAATVGRWYHAMLTYDTEKLTVYLDGAEVFSYKAAFNLQRGSNYGGLSVGERHLGGSPFARRGEWLVDDVVFGRGVLGFEDVRSQCGEFSRFSFDSGLGDATKMNNLAGEYKAAAGVCGSAQRLVPGANLTNMVPAVTPLGRQQWSISVFANVVTPGRRVLAHVGSGAGIRAGVALGVTEDLKLWVQDNWRMPQVPDVVLKVGQWYHFVMTYDAKTVRVYVDDAEAYAYDVSLALESWGPEAGLVLGSTATGEGTSGEYLIDEVVFASGVVPVSELSLACAPYSVFTFDNDLKDRVGSNDLGGHGGFNGAEDSLCGTSLHLLPNNIYTKAEPARGPLAAQPFTLSIFVKPIQFGRRSFMHIGADSGALHGFDFGVEADAQLFIHDYGTTKRGGKLEANKWYHVAVTYDSATVKLFLDGNEVLQHTVELELLPHSPYGGLQIGGRHMGGSRRTRDGEFLVDEAVFGRGILDLKALRVPCRTVSSFTFDADLKDHTGPNDLFGAYLPERSDSVAGAAQRLLPNQLHGNRNPVSIPVGKASFTLSIHAKIVEAGNRVLMHMGGDEAASPGFAFGLLASRQLFVHDYAGNPVLEFKAEVDRWYHYIVTYDSSTVRVYVDEKLVHSHDVELNLAVTDRHGGLSIGERHLGKDAVARGGEYLVDEAVFGSGLIRFEHLRTNVEIVSRYSFDANLLDGVGSNNLFGEYVTKGIDSICGKALLLQDRKLTGNRDPKNVPLGNEPWTMSLFVKPVVVAQRTLIHLGSDDGRADGAGSGVGIWINGGKLSILDYGRNPRSQFVLKPGRWYHLVATYDSKTVRLYVDEEEVLAYNIQLRLKQKSNYGGLSVGERHLGGSPFSRGGEWLVDEAVFAKGLVPFKRLAPSCFVFAKYNLDTGLQDRAGFTNNLSGRYTSVRDGVQCGAGHRLRDPLRKSNPKSTPTGRQSWTMAMTVRQYGAGGVELMHLGATSRNRGISIGVDNKGIRIIDYGNNPRVSFGWKRDVWYHLAMTYDGAAVTVYVNGNQVASLGRALNLAAGTLSMGGQMPHSSLPPFLRRKENYGNFVVDEVSFGRGLVGLDTLRECNLVDINIAPAGGFFTVTGAARTMADECRSVWTTLKVPSFKKFEGKVNLVHRGECGEAGAVWKASGSFPQAEVRNMELVNMDLVMTQKSDGSWDCRMGGFVEPPGGNVLPVEVVFTGSSLVSVGASGTLVLGPVRAEAKHLDVSASGHLSGAAAVQALFDNSRLPAVQGRVTQTAGGWTVSASGDMDMVSFDLFDTALSLDLTPANGGYVAKGSLKGNVRFLNTTLAVSGAVDANTLGAMKGALVSDMHDVDVTGDVTLHPDTVEGCGVLEGKLTVVFERFGRKSVQMDLRYDPCTQHVGDAVMAAEGIAVGRTTPFPGVAVTGGVLDVVGEVYVDYEGQPTLDFNGILKGSTVVLGQTQEATAVVEAGVVTSVQVTMAHARAGVRVAGGFVYSGTQCTAANRGTVTVTIPAAGLASQEVELVQKDGCDAAGNAEYLVEFQAAAPLSYRGLALKEADVTVAASQSGSDFALRADIDAVVAFTPDGNNDVDVKVVFDGTEGGQLTGFADHLSLGDVSGNFTFATGDAAGVLSGTGTMELVTDNAVVPAMADAKVEYFYGATPPKWTVEGQLDKWRLHGVDMTEVQVKLTGTYHEAGGAHHVLWGGEVRGSASYGGIPTEVKATITPSLVETVLGRVQMTADGGSSEVPSVAPDGCPDSPVAEVTMQTPAVSVKAAFGYTACSLDDNGVLSFTVSGQMGAAESVTLIPGVAITAANVRARGVVSLEGGSPVTTWSGFLLGSARIFGTDVTATATFQDGRLEETRADVVIKRSAWSLRGSVTYTREQCTAANTGSVFLTLDTLGISASGTMTQMDTCGSDGRPRWTLEASSDDDLHLFGVTVSSLKVFATPREGADGTTHWVVALQGALLLENAEGMRGGAVATVEYDTEHGVKSFVADGTVQAGPLSLTAHLDVADGLVTGSGTLDLELENGRVEGAEVTVKYATRVVAGSSDEQWHVTGTVASMKLLGVELEQVSVDLASTVKADKAVVWSGTVGGTLTIQEASLTLQAVLAESKFESLTGDLAVDVGNVAFQGTVEIEADEGCAAIDAVGSLTVKDPALAFDSTLTFDKCADKAGDVRFAVSGESSLPIVLGDLTLTSATVDFASRVPDSEMGPAVWSGKVTANADLFGATATASVSFDDGKVTGTHVETNFRLANGILQGTVGFDYVAGCDAPSTGFGNALIDMEGADDLAFSGTVEYSRCTGVVKIDAQVEGSWSGPAGALNDLRVVIESEGHGGNQSKKLGDRVWTGTISAGLSSITFDTETALSGATATIAFSNENVDVAVTYNQGTCTGTGVAILKNLPNGVPAMETEVSVVKANCQVEGSKGWTVTGAVKNLEIPFFGNKLSLQEVRVEVSEDAQGDKSANVTGTFMKDYSLTLGFPLPVKGKAITITGMKLPTSTADTSPDSFSTAFGGGGGSASPFASGLGSGLPLFDAVKKVKLSGVTLAASFEDKSLRLTADATISGMAVTASLVVQKKTKWVFGVSLRANRVSDSNMGGILGTALEVLEPQFAEFSLATQQITLGDGTDLKKGLTLRAALGSDNPLAKQADSQSPAELRDQVKAAKGDTPGLVVVANLVSTKEVTVFLQLAGNIRLGDGAYLKEVALAFTIGVGGPEVGFMVGLEFTLGSGSTAKVLTTKAFLALSAGGLTLEMLINLAPPRWERPFGVKGLAIIFPLGLGLTISPALLPTSFSMMGGLEVGDAKGELVMGVDLKDFSKSAFHFTVENFNLQQILEEVGGCKACTSGVAGVLTDISFQKFEASINADPVNEAVITFVDHSRTIEPGIHILMEKLNLWGVLKIERAYFGIDASGMAVELNADKLDWGPLEITSATDTSKGPNFKLVLKKDEKILRIDGRASVLGQSVSLYLLISDAKKEGFFKLNFIGSELAVTWSCVGTPGKSDFKNTITAELKADIFAKIIDKATDFLDELKQKANKKFDDAQADLRAAQKKLNDAKASLERERVRLNKDFDKASAEVRSLNSQINSMKSKCRKYQKQCKGWKIGKCFLVPGCWIAVGALEAAKLVALGAVEIARGIVNAGLAVAKGAVDVAKGAVSVASVAVEAARGAVTAFLELGKAVLGVLKNILRIKYIKFSTALSSTSIAVDFEADIVVFGISLQPKFHIELNFDALLKSISNTVRNALRGVFGNRIPGL